MGRLQWEGKDESPSVLGRTEDAGVGEGSRGRWQVLAAGLPS